jgi:hypothetical protein
MQRALATARDTAMACPVFALRASIEAGCLREYTNEKGPTPKIGGRPFGDEANVFEAARSHGRLMFGG